MEQNHWASLPADPADMPLDMLAVAVLRMYSASGEWSIHNWMGRVHLPSGSDNQAIFEAVAWLRSTGLLAEKLSNIGGGGDFVTRLGHRVLAEGLLPLQVLTRLQGGIHPTIEAEARPQFMLGKYELGVFAGMKAVEVRVRQLGGFGSEVIGVDLMNRAFGPNGTLTDTSAVKGEQEATRALFGGAYGVLRNPSGHREVDYDDIGEAADAVQTASLLMRMLDRIEQRLAGDA